MPRKLTIRSLLTALTMAVVSLCGGGKAVAEQKGTLSVIEVVERDSAVENELEVVANDLRKSFRETGVRRGTPRITIDGVSIKVQQSEEFDLAAEALWVVAEKHALVLEQNRADGEFVLAVTDAYRERIFQNVGPRAVRFLRYSLSRRCNDASVALRRDDLIAVWTSSCSRSFVDSHGPQLRWLNVHFVIAGPKDPEQQNGPTRPVDAVMRDFHKPNLTWVVDKIPAVSLRDVRNLNATKHHDRSAMEFELQNFIVPKLHWAHSFPDTAKLALVLDDRVLNVREARMALSDQGFSFFSGLSVEETEALVAEVDPIAFSVKFRLLKQCPKPQLADLREMSC